MWSMFKQIASLFTLKNFLALVCTSLTLLLVYQELYTFSIARPTTISTEEGFLQFHEFFSLMALFWILECYMQELLLLRLLLLCPKAVLRSISLSDLGLGLLSPTFYLSTGYSKWICCFHKELSWPCTYLVSGIFPSYLCGNK